MGGGVGEKEREGGFTFLFDRQGQWTSSSSMWREEQDAGCAEIEKGCGKMNVFFWECSRRASVTIGNKAVEGWQRGRKIASSDSEVCKFSFKQRTGKVG